MNRIFVKQGLSLFGITLLLLAGLAGCGGDEAAPVARPPAPPPAPPAFTPEAVEVTLGESGDSATLMTTEAGGFTLDGEAFESGGMVTAENGNVYTLTLADGAWTPVFNAPMVDVMLSELGGPITVTTAEDGTYWVPGLDVAFESGGMVVGENGMYYTLTLVDGEWMPAFVAPDPVMVTLEASGTTITIETAENGTYWVAGELFESGGEVTAENGNMYIVTQVDGEWSAAFQAESMEIMGLDMMVMSTEDGMGYSVGGQMLDENGSGDIMVDGGHFRVSMDDMGMFMAEQFDAKVEDQATLTDRMVSAAIFEGLIGDDEDTAPNEEGTRLRIDEQNHKVSDLFGSGTSVIRADNIIEAQTKDIQKALDRIEALINVIKAGNADATKIGDASETTIDYQALFQARWDDIDDALDFIFGEPDDIENNAPDLISHLEETTVPEDFDKIVGEVEKVLAALSSLEAFTEALGEDGLFAESKRTIKDDDIEGIFNAVSAEWTVNLGRSANTRYGVYAKTQRAGDLATAKLEASAAEADQPKRYGAFAYSPHKPSKIGDLPSSGEAFYTGETIAQEQTEFTIYKGMIDLRVRFRSKSVSGLIRNLMDGDGKMYTRGGEDVDSIILPNGAMTNTASWIVGDGEENATVIFIPRAGAGRPDTVDANFKGQVVGEGENAGAAVIGTWALMATREDEGTEVVHDAGDLVGAYGAERGPDQPITPPDTADDGEKVKTVIHSVTAVTAENFIDDDGMIDVGGTDPAEKMIKVATAALYADGEEMVQGTNFIEALKTALAAQMKTLDAFIALDEADGEDTATPTALTGRETVWAAVKTELEKVFDSEYDHDGDRTEDSPNNEEPVVILSDSVADDGSPPATPEQLTTYPLNRAKDGPDDVTAKEELNDILAALGSLAEFEKATAKDGVFYGETTHADDEDGLLDGQAAKDVFNRVPYTVTVMYGHTDYTRFGSWVRTGSEAAVDAPAYSSDVDTNTGHFAYSQEAQTPSDKFPRGGNATYEGRTIARDNAATTDGAADPKFYHGDIELQVSWAGVDDQGDNEAVTTSDVVAIISNLMDADGGMYTDTDSAVTAAAHGEGKVMMLIFDASVTDANVVLGFTGNGARVRYEGFGLIERSQSGAAITGSFVGESFEGPRGVIGTWSLNDDFSGVYGADILP